MMLLQKLWPIHFLLRPPYSFLGLPLVITGLTVTMWGSGKFRSVQTNIHTFKEPDKLVVDGLYRYSRNPMYLGFAISLLGVCFMLGAASPFIILALFVAVTDRWYIEFEEKMLQKKFGVDYENYKSAVRRWI
ncbi:methyltransferase family protein [Paenibacillus alkalitolerans]|uniref:methyltransferase family protein n=1 Tax=Paenibacillus alkalitolerans TaxID=2799335 RepID=UPI002D7FF103|nr:isoprenylcysteine carboxylmethyltransferase family protein [Paenibacillus alkalitolerans]